MQEARVSLSPQEFAELERLYPRSRGSSDIGFRALAIAKVHLRRVRPGCTFPVPVPPGADLAVLLPGEAAPRLLEIKGTAAETMSWQQLKVSGNQSFALLTQGHASLYRITRVFEREPIIYALMYGRDFRVEPARPSKSTRG